MSQPAADPSPIWWRMVRCRLFRTTRRDRCDLFRLIVRRDVPYTKNACEGALRPSVVFRKVTGGFRADWGARVYAAAATVIATGRLHA